MIYKLARNMHFSTVVVLLLLVVIAAVLAPSAGTIIERQVQQGCDDGTIDAGICWAAEVGGLVTPVAEGVPAPDTEGAAR
jgi:hypothetical protein